MPPFFLGTERDSRRFVLTERTVRTNFDLRLLGRRTAPTGSRTRLGQSATVAEAMDEQDRLIERLGLVFEESDRMPRIASRILGLLLLTPGECSIDQMAERLQVSRASISVDARRLEECGVVERVTHKGDRRDYYRIAPDHYTRTLERRLKVMGRLIAVIDEGRQMKLESREVRDRLDETAEALRFVVDATTQELERWRAEREKRNAERQKTRDRADARAAGVAAGR
jgi:DNA-binding transcriptional regulator GbsR (MarR family)